MPATGAAFIRMRSCLRRREAGRSPGALLSVLSRRRPKPQVIGKGRPQLGLHDLRNSLAAAALERLSLTEASFLLRHANARVTAQVYAGLTEEARRKTAGRLAKAGFGR